jgi:hypothetical protein
LIEHRAERPHPALDRREHVFDVVRDVADHVDDLGASGLLLEAGLLDRRRRLAAKYLENFQVALIELPRPAVRFGSRIQDLHHANGRSVRALHRHGHRGLGPVAALLIQRAVVLVSARNVAGEIRLAALEDLAGDSFVRRHSLAGINIRHRSDHVAKYQRVGVRVVQVNGAALGPQNVEGQLQCFAHHGLDAMVGKQGIAGATDGLDLALAKIQRRLQLG